LRLRTSAYQRDHSFCHPVPPESPNVVIPQFFGASTTRGMFAEFPLAEIAKAASPRKPIASSCREKLAGTRSHFRLPSEQRNRLSAARRKTPPGRRDSALQNAHRCVSRRRHAPICKGDQHSACLEPCQNHGSQFGNLLARALRQLCLDSNASLDFFANLRYQSNHFSQPVVSISDVRRP
jgi:hypothetical protein